MAEHHTVPRMHLRRFADGQKFLMASPRGGGRQVRMSVKRACAEAGYYELELEEPHDQEFPPEFVEGSLSYFEGRVAPIIEGLVQDEFALSMWDRFYLTLFVAFQIARGPAFRRELSEMMTMQARLELQTRVTPKKARNWLRKKGLAADDVAVENFVREALDGAWKLVGSNSAYVQAMLQWVFEDLHPLLFTTRRIRVLRFAQPVLLTSDQPAVLWARPGRDLYAEPLGVATADAIWMPLDRRHALALVASGREGIIDTGFLRAKQINTAVAAAAHDWIFQHPNEEPLDVSRLPRRPELKAEAIRIHEGPGEVRVLNRIYRPTP